MDDAFLCFETGIVIVMAISDKEVFTNNCYFYYFLSVWIVLICVLKLSKVNVIFIVYFQYGWCFFVFWNWNCDSNGYFWGESL